MPRVVMPDDLRPAREMARNDPCWCLSGLKWKNCHKDRHLAKPVNYFELKASQAKVRAKGTCSHPDAPAGCSGQVIRSHTIQRAGGLSAIAEMGHVYSNRESADRLTQNNGALIPQKTGINSASTFPGFCSFHDTAMFLPIESGDLPLDRQSAFLMSYRAMAYERHAKRMAVANLESTRIADSGRPFELQVSIQQQLADMIYGMGLGLADLDRWKSKLDRMFVNNDTSAIGLLAVSFDEALPFVTAFAQQPELDFGNRRLQWLDALKPDQASLTVTVSGKKTVAVFAWPEGPSSAGARLARSFEEVPDEHKPTALLRYVLAASENVHMKPSWFEGLSVADRDDLMQLMQVGLPSIDSPSARIANWTKGSLKLPSATSTSRWL